ncbi:helix-turn-helix domain-containing protein [Carbonactinospora thermoautotrophica]|uniref:helix-turn-helix domain-containing protein n=1 Tax=Carbonactinospora thermoautotrophica TaxID=1469144 RepID=UPI00226EF6CA|nr:helix-turn-helix transcriptional regulator [Carbonactinospora thermoautotrophica]
MEKLECHASKISRVENGRSGVRPRDVRDMLDLYGVTDEGEREALPWPGGKSVAGGRRTRRTRAACCQAPTST